jgi:hypothetical protein
MTVDWIKHGETKAAISLAASGVVLGVLFNLVRTSPPREWRESLPAILCALLTVAAALFCILSLRPRLAATQSNKSNLYFGDIATSYTRSSGPEPYLTNLRLLLNDNDRLLDEIGVQIWENAQIAQQRFRHSTSALRLLLWALAPLAVVGVEAALPSR